MRAFVALPLLVLVACRPGADADTSRKLDQVLQRIQVLEEKNELLAQRIALLTDVNDRLDRALRAALGGGGAEEGEAPQRPDPSSVFSVPIDGDPVRGPATAKVTIVQGSEFACPYCLKVRPTLAEIEKLYGKDVRVVHKSFLVHPQYATEAALAACAAQQQGKYWEMEAAIWDHVWDAETGEPKDPEYLEEEKLLELAKGLKADLKKFKADMTGERCKDQIERQERELARVGTRGTPSFYINGRYLSGAQPLDAFRRVIDEEIAKADQALKTGIKPERYYDTIVATGIKVFEE